MPDLRGTRKKLTIAIAALVVADIVAAGILFSPLVGSAESRRTQMRQLSAELQKKTHDVEPLRGMDKKIVLAKDQIGDFYKGRFAAKDSELTTELGKLAAQERHPNPAGKIQGRRTGELRHRAGCHRWKFCRRLPPTRPLHQHIGTFQDVLYRRQRGPCRRRHRTGPAANWPA